MKEDIISEAKLSVEQWYSKDGLRDEGHVRAIIKDSARQMIAEQLVLDALKMEDTQSKCCVRFSGYFFTKAKLMKMIDEIEKSTIIRMGFANK